MQQHILSPLPPTCLSLPAKDLEVRQTRQIFGKKTLTGRWLFATQTTATSSSKGLLVSGNLGEGRIISSKRSKSYSRRDLLGVTVHGVRTFHTGRRQLLACGTRPSWEQHSWRKGCPNSSHRGILLKCDQPAPMHKAKGHGCASKHTKCLHSRSFVSTVLNHNAKLENNPFRKTGFSKLWENSSNTQWRAEDSRCSYSKATLAQAAAEPGFVVGIAADWPGLSCSHWGTELELAQLLCLWEVHTDLSNQHTALHTVTPELATLDQEKISSHTEHCYTKHIIRLSKKKIWNIAIVKHFCSVAIWLLWHIEMRRKQRKILGKLQ